MPPRPIDSRENALVGGDGAVGFLAVAVVAVAPLGEAGDEMDPGLVAGLNGDDGVN